MYCLFLQEWSDALATRAQVYVDKCILQPPLGATPWAGQKHVGDPNKFHDENPLLSADSLVSTAIETWYAEKFGWTYGALDCHDSCGYTQVSRINLKTDNHIYIEDAIQGLKKRRCIYNI